MEAPLTIFYTARLRGDLDLAPRLFSLIRSLKTQIEGAALLVDLGDSSDLRVWHCAVTGGRSALFALDAMGYDAANADHLHPQNRAKTQPGMRLALIGAGESVRLKGCRLLVPPDSSGANPARLNILLVPAAETALNDRVLSLATVEGGQVGAAQIAFGAGTMALTAAHIYDLSPDTPPDPTIAGAIDFILSEAHYLLKKAQERRR